MFEGMRRMELNLGVIRDRHEIHSALMQSHSTKRQLAVCFNNDGKLLVKICSVTAIERTKAGVQVTLRSQGGDMEDDLTVLLDHIESVYRMRDFHP